MLTTGRRSRLRLTLGGTAVAALMVAGLAGTASGTAAASTVRAGVEKATGLNIAALDTKLATRLQSAHAAPSEGSALPEPPAAPAIDVVPPAPTPMIDVVPPAPQVTTTTNENSTTMVVSDGADGKKSMKRVKIVRLGKNGDVMNEDYRNLADIPDVRSANCGGSSKNVVVNRANGSHRVMIICNDRIEAMTENAVAESMKGRDYQRLAYAKALEGVRAAREGIATNSSMSAEAKRDALESMDDTIRDLQDDMANDD